MFWRQKKITAHVHEPIAANTPLNQLTFLVFDTETTGFNIKQEDRLIEIGAVIIKNLQITDHRFHSYVNPLRDIPLVIEQLTGISQNSVEQAPLSLEGIEAFFQFISQQKPVCWIGFHLAFDLTVLRCELKRWQHTYPLPSSIELLDLLRFFHPTSSKRDLDDYAREWAVPLCGRHTALGDARITADLFCRLLSTLEEQEIKTWGELLPILNQSRQLSTANRFG